MPTAEIAGIGKVREHLGAFAFSEFQLLRDLHIYEAEAVSRRHPRVLNLDLVIDSQERVPGCRLTLRFSGVRDFRMSEGALNQICGFAINDISDRQWENVRWEVIDYENGDLAFVCAEAEVVSVAAL